MNDLSHQHRLVSANGGEVQYIAEDGELLASVAVPPGIHPAGQYLELCPDGAFMHLEGLAALKPRERVSIQGYGDAAFASSANPDFQVTSATRMEMEMRLMLNKMKASTKRMEARANAVNLIEAIPKNPKKEEILPRDEKSADSGAPGQNKTGENPASEE